MTKSKNSIAQEVIKPTEEETIKEEMIEEVIKPTDKE
jgi:hypothetical protein